MDGHTNGQPEKMMSLPASLEWSVVQCDCVRNTDWSSNIQITAGYSIINIVVV